MSAQHTPGPLAAVKLADRSAYNIFAPGYATAIATVSSQTSAHGCMGSIVTRQYALAMAAGPELLAALQAEEEWRAREAAGALDHEWDYERMVGDKRRAAIAKVTGSAA